MGKYGWDNLREEGLQELLRIKESRTLGNKSTQKSFLDIYYAIYKNKNEHEIKGTAFYAKEITSGLISEAEAYAKASDVIQRLRSSVKRFYASHEGKESPYEVYFVAESRDYRLGIRPKKRKEQTEKQDESVSYNEYQHFITKQRPSVIRILSVILLFISPFLTFISAIIVYVERTHSSWLMLFIGSCGLILGILLGYAGIVLNKSLSRRLVYFFAKYFIRTTIQDIVLVSYSGKCSVPECKGNVFLSHEFKKGTGYIAKCSDYPDGHRYSIDPTTLKGDRIRT